jgi:hypothetical protein
MRNWPEFTIGCEVVSAPRDKETLKDNEIQWIKEKEQLTGDDEIRSTQERTEWLKQWLNLLHPSTPVKQPSGPSKASQPPTTTGQLKSRVVKHSPSAMGEWDSDAERVDVLKALKEIKWSLNSNPKQAADEDYASIQKYLDAYAGTVSKNNIFASLYTEAQADGNLSSLRDLDRTECTRIGNLVLEALENSIVSELEHHRMWGLDLLAGSTRWDHADKFFRMLGEAGDPAVSRKLILAMGRAHQRHWFQTRWRELFSESPWPKRTLIAAASCFSCKMRGNAGTTRLNLGSIRLNEL